MMGKGHVCSQTICIHTTPLSSSVDSFVWLDDKAAGDVIERAHHRHLPGVPWCRHTQIGPAFCPGSRQIRMRQRLALVSEEQDNIARFGLGLAQLQT